MRVEIIPCLQDNYSYLIIDDNNNSACVVDPGEAKPIVDYLKNKNISNTFGQILFRLLSAKEFIKIYD